MRAAATKSHSKPATPAVICVGDDSHPQQQETFNLCPLGMQFYSCKPLREFDLFEFNLQVNGDARGRRGAPVKCTGAVVRCLHEKENERYRVWIQFLDVPKRARDKIRCVCKSGKHLCSYCENF